MPKRRSEDKEISSGVKLDSKKRGAYYLLLASVE